MRLRRGQTSPKEKNRARENDRKLESIKQHTKSIRESKVRAPEAELTLVNLINDVRKLHDNGMSRSVPAML